MHRLKIKADCNAATGNRESVVEAAGVEPASEKACCQKNYMLIPFAKFREAR